jgi:hypothetical protein
MEKEQMIDAFGVGCQVESTRLIGYQGMAEQYYNETYGGNNHLCCTPIGQIKRYVNCIGCDRKPLTYGGNK